MHATPIARLSLLAILAAPIACREMPPEPALGSIAVTTVTTGPDQDEEYVLSVAGLRDEAIDANGTHMLSSFPTGTRRVFLGDVSPNCNVGGSNPRDVSVSSNAQASLAFEVSCVGGGTVYLSTATTGFDRDDRYLVVLASEPVMDIGPTGLVILPALVSGSRLLGLDDVAPNCTVEGDNPRAVPVPPEVVTAASFAVRCVGLGAIDVTARTTGSDLDGDGYTVVVDGGSIGSVPANATTTFQEIGTGTRAVSLSGVARNCTVAGPATLTLSVGAGAPTPAQFDLDCRPAPILFARSGDGNRGIYVMNADGTGEQRLTVHPYGSPNFDIQPQWSPDGNRITFASNRDGNWDIFVMGADGSDPTNLTAHPANDQDPAWSPDGSRIAFQSNRSGGDRIHSMRPDGSDVTELTDGSLDRSPAWSPDGSSLAFVGSTDNSVGLYVMSIASSTVRRLSTPGWSVSGRPSWSPDATEIAFSSDGGGQWFQVFVIGAGGGALRQLTADSSASHSPTWSPDGNKIAFVALRDGPGTIYVMATDGTDQLPLGPQARGDGYPAWKW